MGKESLSHPGEDLPRRLCSVCGNPLSQYNKTESCFHHPDLELREGKRLKEQASCPQGMADRGVFPEVIPIDVSQADKITRLVCQDHEITHKDLFGRSRKAEIVLARHILMYLLYIDAHKSYPQTGRLVGDRDHTTVLHGVRKITKAIANNRSLVTSSIVRIRSRY